jgi:hypothetical protein
LNQHSKLRGSLTYANVMATVAVFLALGGGAYAATQLPKNSVGTKQLKKNAVTTAKIKKQAVTAVKVKNGTLTGTQINASTLGTVPTADKATTLAAPEAFHEVTATGEPGFQNSWHNFPQEPGGPVTVGFYKDQEGVVHLKGAADGGTNPTIFQLPAGFRPASGRILGFAVICSGCGANTGGLVIAGSDGAVQAPVGAIRVGLDGVTFRAES